MTQSVQKLNTDLALKIRKAIVKGDTVTQIQKDLNINDSNWDYWYWKNTLINKGDTKGFRDLINDFRREKLLKSAEDFSKELMDTNHKHIKETEKGEMEIIDDKILRIKQKESEYLRDTLGRDTYAKRIENVNANIDYNPTDEEKNKIDTIFEVNSEQENETKD